MVSSKARCGNFGIGSEYLLAYRGILEGFPFIWSLIRKNTSGNRLYALLGNTFGNLDIAEINFAHQIRSVMNAEDHLVIEVSLAGRDWSWESDPRTQPRKFNRNYRRFIAVGVNRRTGIAIDNVSRHFSRNVCFKQGASAVPGTKTICIKERRNQFLITMIRRFDWPMLLDWFRSQGFSVQYEESTYYNQHGREIIGNGIVRLGRAT